MKTANHHPLFRSSTLPLSHSPVAVYIHTPFCPTKCGYCDFNSFAMTGAIHERTVRAIVEEIRRSAWRGRPAKTIFFGGGTPTYLEAGQIERILMAALESHPPIEGCEITSEANPGTVDAEKFGAMRRMGFNRISIGAQSFLDSDLERLGRVHRSGEIEKAIRVARFAGFENLNLDLMFALPGQSLDAWKANLDKAISLQPEHLSLYCLTLEPNTPFYREHLRGQLVQPDEDAQVEMYDLAIETTSAAGYAQYEISNFAKPGNECRHNLAYWRYEEYLGYGPGAVGCFEGRKSARRTEERKNGSEDEIGSDSTFDLRPSTLRVRYTNLKHPARYCEAIETKSDLWCESEELSGETQTMERVMLGIRLNEGLPVSAIGASESQISNLKSKRWIEQQNGTIRLTKSGRNWCSEVALALT